MNFIFITRMQKYTITPNLETIRTTAFKTRKMCWKQERMARCTLKHGNTCHNAKYTGL